MNQSSLVAVAVVGAGPYGISIAAHLKASGVDCRIFGSPLNRWRRQMPQGMFLKSDGFASNLSDPSRTYTLARYCRQMGIPYRDTGWPVPLEVFTGYAMDFQKRLVPGVEEVQVERIQKENGVFRLDLAAGGSFRARKVVVAAGLEHAAHIPPELAALPADLLSHVSAHHDLTCFRGKDVTVIGAGQSALEIAALLAEQGASVRVLARGREVVWNAPPNRHNRSLYRRLRSPASGLGLGLQLWAYSSAPGPFRYLPRAIRFDRALRVLGPAGGWWLRERVDGKLPVLPEHTVIHAEARKDGVTLHVRQPEGERLQIRTDHVIAATGYRFALDRLAFLSPSLISLVRTERRAPVLSSNFESTASGLYFTGLASAPSFGPSMRFLYGTEFTAGRVSNHLAALAHKGYRQDLSLVNAANT